jgi:tyrosine-specific transport protein
VLYLLLAYSLLTAYCTKAADVLGFFVGGALPPLAAAAAVAGGVGSLLYGGGPRATDALCQTLTSALLALFAVILAAGGAAAGGGGVAAAAATADWGALQPALPIIFLALVYHDLVPVIVDYLGGDRKAIRWVVARRRHPALAATVVPT